MKKKVWIILMVLPLLSLANGIKESPLIGTWQSSDSKEKRIIKFDKEGYITITIGNEIKGGKGYYEDDVLTSFSYRILNDSNPYEVDIIITAVDYNETQTFMCTAILLNEDTMIFAIGSQKERPIELNNDNSTSFSRIK